MNKPSIYHMQGYNCAEALIKTYNEEFDQNIPIALGSGMGSGVTVGSLCGAINAAIMVVGFIKGRNDNQSVNEARMYSNILMKKIKAEYNSEICIDLKRSGVSCDDIIDFSYEAMKEIL